jgi:hypothetical protein
VQSCWKKLGKEIGLAALMVTLAPVVGRAASTAAVSGVVRDTQGVAQMGAMVEVLAAGSASVATAFTDMYGRYRIANLVPGKYQVRATAALFVPAMRNNLQLSTGMRATVNLTLNMLSDPAAWLPAKRRAPDEPGDDWTWTLRSGENRPILRMADDGDVVLVSSAGAERPRSARVHARVSLMGGDGGFGAGGLRNVLALERETHDGSDLMMRTEWAVGKGNGTAAPAEIDAGYQRKGSFGNSSRMVVSYASHPEIMSAGDTTGMQLLRIASAEKMQLGDTVEVEAGGTVYAIQMAGGVLTEEPFLRVAVHPGEVWAVEYRLATSRDLQGYKDLDSIQTDLPVAALSGGRLSTASGTHQEIAVSRKAGEGQVEAAVYRDVINRSAIAGTGALSPADLAPAGESSAVVVDTATNNFRFLGSGYTTEGVRLMISEPLTQDLWAELEYATGAGLSTGNGAAGDLSQVAAGLHEETGSEITASLRGHVARTGTKVRAAYRWQPQNLVTAVAPYEGFGDKAYLSLYVRQAVRWGNKLPPGLAATIDVTNLLAQGYHPFLSADGRTLYLTQSPRTLQAGLSFTF